VIVCDTGPIVAAALVEDDRRAAALVWTDADMPLGTTDATVIAIAERLGLAEVATLDRRHFTVVRPVHVSALTLLP
jgi:predicted nucleic acid-binding protein